MSKVGSWSTTADNNNSSPPDGWPEGQAPSTVNNCAREMMASIRTLVSDLQYIDYNNTPTFATATTFNMNTADPTNFHVGRRVKLYDGTTLYGTINSVSAGFVSVRLDAGALTASLSSVALAVVTENNCSLPQSMYRHTDVLVNGQLDSWQRGTSFQPANSTRVAFADDWVYLQSASAAVNISRKERSADAANVPTVAQCGMVLDYSVCFSVSAADAAIAAGEFAHFTQVIEGPDFRQLMFKPNALSFWTKTNRSGIYAVALHSGARSACFVQNFTLTAVDTWTRFSISVPEHPSSVTWNTGVGQAGMRVHFVLAAGSSLQATGGEWSTTALATSSQQNFLATAGNTIHFAGFKLEDGTHSTPLDVINAADNTNRCQRYVEKSYPLETPPATASLSLAGCCVVFTTGTFNCPGTMFKATKAVVSATGLQVYRPSTGSLSAIEYLDGSSAFSILSTEWDVNGIQNFAFAVSAGNSANVKFHFLVSAEIA